ncbi:type VI secretion system-associated FHA domain protein TagH [Psychromonas sp.]|nr:type VI secretion system-associated FHA domain protein TagH [Psychromonas sp.]
MPIEISVLYSPENVDVLQPRHIFPDEGGTLGRSSNNFWVLQDPNKYMSSVHARIENISGLYYLTDMSTNGTFINGAAEPVGNGNQVQLMDGDHFTISDYEFVTKIEKALADSVDYSSPINDDPFSDFNFPETETDAELDFLSPSTPENDPFASGINQFAVSDSQVNTQAIDPMEILDRKSPASDSPFMAAKPLDSFTSNKVFSNSPNVAAENSYKSQPVVTDSIEWPVAKPEAFTIPDDWDDWDSEPEASADVALTKSFAIPDDPFTDDDLFAQPPVDSHTKKTQKAAAIVDVIKPDASAKNPFVQQPNLDEKDFNDFIEDSTTQIPSVYPDIQPSQKTTHSDAEFDALVIQNRQLQEKITALTLQLQQAENEKHTNTAITSQVTNNSEPLNAVVQAMGLSKWNLEPSKIDEINNTVGLLMRETMQGMMRVLKFRKKIKEEFRINVTTIQSVENNPLKFSANIEDAMENMFIKDNNAYKSPVDAVREGFESIAEHQVAVVAGMQAAFRGMIERFNPTQLENRFEKYNNASFLSLGQKTKRWNDYKAYHKDLTENLDDSFQHLFGYDFVQAYEEQMQHLISARITEKQQSSHSN